MNDTLYSANITKTRCAEILSAADSVKILVLGDIMLDHFIWGRVGRISPEAPVPIVALSRENYIAGGAANVACNLTSLGAKSALVGVTGRDEPANHLRQLLRDCGVKIGGLISSTHCQTSVKMRIIGGQQQVVRLDRESNGTLDARVSSSLQRLLDVALNEADAVIVGDYGKGVVTQILLDRLRRHCCRHRQWLSLDPKPVHALNLAGLSLLTPNRREIFALTGLSDSTYSTKPLLDKQLMKAANRLMRQVYPTVLLVTLGELGMLLCTKNRRPVHIGTVAREVFDVSGAGDTVIASFTLAIAAGATPLEAAIFSNHAAGIAVGKIGTATVTPSELSESFGRF